MTANPERKIPMYRMLCALVAAFALVAATATTAEAQRPVKFRVQIKASQTTDWKQPYYETANNCFNRPWIQGEGGEVVKFKGSGTAYAHKIGSSTIWTYGSPRFGPTGLHGIPLTATNERRYHLARGNKPGPCGGGSPEEVEPAECGTRSGKAFGQLAFQDKNRRLLLRVNERTSGSATPTDLGFDKCDILTPPGVDAAWLTEITQKAPARELLDPDFKKHIVIARKAFTHTLYPDAATITMNTNVFWQVTLTRLK
ncbi:MAG: hypothetical protein M3340_06660 [Actinomycetota bacterium]|nr:hypothetical protein [Actinomycetota bacterium]